MKKKKDSEAPADSLKKFQDGMFPKGKSGNPGGRPVKSPRWKKAEAELREALPRVLLMRKSDLQKLLADNPTGVEMLAAKYVHEHENECVNRFLGKMPTVLTGEDGEPLIPTPPAPPPAPINFTGWTAAQIDRFIEATKPA